MTDAPPDPQRSDPAPAGTTDLDPGHRPRLPLLLIGAALVVAIAAVIVVVVLSQRANTQATDQANAPASSGPLGVPAVDQPGAGGKYCTIIDSALPNRLAGLARRSLIDGQPGVAAFGPDPAVIWRCGIQTPQELTCSAELQQVIVGGTGDGVEWLRLDESGDETWIAVDRAVRIAITLPEGSSDGTAVIQAATQLIAADLTPRSVCDNGTVVAPDNG